MNKIIEAAQFAKVSHSNQRRKYSGKPYITHLTRVASRVMLLDRVTEDMVIAAILHDIVEDTRVSLDEVRYRFGEIVGQLVWELTNPSKGKILPRKDRKEMDRRHLRVVSNEAKCIKMIDRIDNLCEISDAPMSFKELYIRESILLLNEIKDANEDLAQEFLEAIEDCE